jgi:hypothetical protein
MNRFLRRFLLFFTPLFALALVVLIVDPYNYFFDHNFVPNKVKFHVINRSAESMPRGNTLWKLIDFKKHPVKNILIGDSRAYDLNVDTVRKFSGIQFYNFGVPGGNYNSIIETFWYLTSLVKPERVYIQVGFHNYSENSSYDLMADAKKVYKRPYFFFSRFYFLQESFLDLYYSVKGVPTDQTDGKFNEQTWNRTLQSQGNSALASMKYPAKYHDELVKISKYCTDNNIELVFIIFPDQQDFHDLIARHSLTGLYQKYKADMNALGKVIDFDNPGNGIIKSRSNYRDIYHLNHDLIYHYIIPNIWPKP